MKNRCFFSFVNVSARAWGIFLTDCTTAPLLTYVIDLINKKRGAVGGAVVVQLVQLVVQSRTVFYNCTTEQSRMITGFAGKWCSGAVV